MSCKCCAKVTGPPRHETYVPLCPRRRALFRMGRLAAFPAGGAERCPSRPGGGARRCCPRGAKVCAKRCRPRGQGSRRCRPRGGGCGPSGAAREAKAPSGACCPRGGGGANRCRPPARQGLQAEDVQSVGDPSRVRTAWLRRASEYWSSMQRTLPYDCRAHILQWHTERQHKVHEPRPQGVDNVLACAESHHIQAVSKGVATTGALTESRKRSSGIVTHTLKSLFDGSRSYS